jgi:hypothetical protein
MGSDIWLTFAFAAVTAGIAAITNHDAAVKNI